jgi:hypothetical protein
MHGVIANGIEDFIKKFSGIVWLGIIWNFKIENKITISCFQMQFCCSDWNFLWCSLLNVLKWLKCINVVEFKFQKMIFTLSMKFDVHFPIYEYFCVELWTWNLNE